jgi:hypothetical protein
MGYRTEYPSQAELKQTFDYRDGELWWKVTAPKRDMTKPAGCKSQNGYMITNYMFKGNRRKYLIHRLIWIWHHGNDPDTIDHINRDRADNRIENLRDVSLSVNHMNRCDTHTVNKLPKGVTKQSGAKLKPYKVQRKVNGKQTFVGIYETIPEAVAAYRAFSLGAGLPVFD